MNGQSLHKTVDRVAGTASLICSFHCILTPVLLVLLPFVGFAGISWLENEKFELIFIAISCTMALASICYGFSRHGRKNVLFIMAFGILTIVIAHHIHENHNGVAGSLMMALGGFQLCVSHYLNMKLCGACGTCHNHS